MLTCCPSPAMPPGCTCQDEVPWAEGGGGLFVLKSESRLGDKQKDEEEEKEEYCRCPTPLSPQKIPANAADARCQDPQAEMKPRWCAPLRLPPPPQPRIMRRQHVAASIRKCPNRAKTRVVTAFSAFSKLPAASETRPDPLMLMMRTLSGVVWGCPTKGIKNAFSAKAKNGTMMRVPIHDRREGKVEVGGDGKVDAVAVNYTTRLGAAWPLAAAAVGKEGPVSARGRRFSLSPRIAGGPQINHRIRWLGDKRPKHTLFHEASFVSCPAHLHQHPVFGLTSRCK